MRKYFYTICFLFLSVICFSACSHSDNAQNLIQVQTPNAPYWQDNLIQWDPVYNATSYIVNINDTEYTIYTNSAPLQVKAQPTQYNIKIKACGDYKTYKDSEYSEVLTLSTEQLATPTIKNEFTVGYKGEYGAVVLGLGKEVDFIKVLINDTQYKFQAKNEYALRINKEMCKSGSNTIKIQACSDDNLFLDSEVLSFTIQKNYEPLNIKTKDGNIYYTLPDSTGQATTEVVQFKESIKNGNVDVSIINYGVNNVLSSDPVVFNVYQIQAIDSYSLLQYVKRSDGSTDFYLKRVYLNSTEGTDFDLIRITFYSKSGSVMSIHHAAIENDPYSKPIIGMSSFNPYDVGKVTATLINTNHPEYLTTEVQIRFKNGSVS